jgi:phage-related protein
VTWQTLGKTIEETYNAQVELNKVFGQGQERLSETYKAISDAAPRVARLGGDMKDVQDTMIGIAEASRRNVIANTEDVEKLYAATQVVGGSAQELSESFLDIGVGIEQIPKQLEESVNYIRSIGGNTKAVMKDVAANMDQMNRYQFAGGVQGLTKMAAQASMLRFDMNQTFQLADKVLDPEKAVDVASAFQRLGVAAGNLTDPFQLMNQSINDPSGLQDSLAQVAKQYSHPI